MRIRVSLLPPADSDATATDVAVVIDVLRATSVMAAAMHAGARRIVTCREVSEALQLARKTSPRPLLCGERGCVPIPGFDLGNSPAEYGADRIAGKSLVLTTTNGTQAIASATGAKGVIAASFLNLTAVIGFLAEAESIHLICAGTRGQITAEDVLLAGALACGCETRYGAAISDDESLLARQLWQSWFPRSGGRSVDDRWLPDPTNLSRRLRETRGGRNLVRVGYQEDLDRCAAIDSCPVVPRCDGMSPPTFRLPT